MLLMMLQTMEEERADPRQLQQLLLDIARGEREALATLYEGCRVPVYALALSILRRHQDAQDVTQDTFVRIWEKAESYRPQGSPMAWILTITRNLARMKLRQGGRLVELEPEQWQMLPAGESGLTPEDRAALESALGQLSAGEREVVLLHAVTGLKHREIAALLRRPLPTILSQYHRALKKLRVQMEGDDTP